MIWTRECPTCKILGKDGYKHEPVWLNPADALARGINHGDIIQVFNERGIVPGGV
jgi:anaerobic selenocysteine-containing dehydrogenase